VILKLPLYPQITGIGLMTVATAPLVSKNDVDAAIHILGTAPIIGVSGFASYVN